MATGQRSSANDIPGHMFLIYEETDNHKTSQKVSFGSYRGPLQIPIDIGPMLLTLHAING